MAFTVFSRSSWGSRITDLLVLTTSFLLFVGLMDIRISQQVIINLAFYVVVMFICLRFARRIIFAHINYSKRVFNVVLGNVAGLLLGSLLVLVVNRFVSVLSENTILVICASILAFFVLGTLAPLIKASQRDKMIHH